MGEDCISNLSDELILFILSFLPLDSAIRTGVLSKRWLHLWKYLKLIHFPPLPGEETKRDYGSIDQCIHSLAPLEGQKIDKFIVEGRFETPYSYEESSLRSWVEFAVARRVSCLELYMMVDNEELLFPEISPDDQRSCFKLPYSFYLQTDESSMENIALSCVVFNPPLHCLGNFGFANLKKLFLFDSELVDESIASTISRCKLLESASLIECFGLRCPIISSASLKEFIFIARDGNDSMRVEIDAPNLKTIVCFRLAMWIFEFNKNCYLLEITIFEQLGGDDPRNGNPRLLLDQLCHAKYFAFNHAFLHVLAKYVKCGPCTTFSNLEDIHFAGYYPGEDVIVPFFTFLGNCPSLTKLKIEFDYLDAAYDGTLKMLPIKKEVYVPYDKVDFISEWDLNGEEAAAILKEVSLEELKTIELFHYWSTKDVLEIVRHLLQKAVNLENIVLSFYSPEHHVLKNDPELVWPLDMQERVKEEISLLPKASPHAKVFIR